ncbi:hypothetical protein Pmani_004621 [Petrolisthes manimaculis]|uniref:Peptidase S1 domain-containing protein n=1 Tax=Petrolisthes manimaculis TaxID=1843537 RepID=A0AAE1QGH9_9EUCA|nr:hypothetical protein Pmani_004621 [Petrolisthes manimaculis]
MITKWVIMVVLVLVVTVVVVEATRLPRRASKCRPRQVCTALKSCKTFEEYLTNPTPELWRRINRASCSSNENERRSKYVCCSNVIEGATDTTPTDPTDATPTDPVSTPDATPTDPASNPDTSPSDPASNPDTSPSDPTDATPTDPASNPDTSPSDPASTPDTSPSDPTDATPTDPVITPNPDSGESLLPSKCSAASRVSRQVVDPQVGPDVVNGEDSNLQELPWTVILGYNSTTEPFWACGGTLISEQYVVTAAHCVHLTYNQGATLEVVRLGEYDLSSVEDCSGITCAPATQDFTPEQIILHPDFDTRAEVSDDIALIRLNKKATLNGYVEPLCLPPAGAGVEGLLGGLEAEVAGWGLTETGPQATVLQKASLPFVNKDTCNPQYNDTLLPEQICFGGSTQNACQGDSGGPLVLRGTNPLLIGIVSRGLDSQCGLIGVPAFYTDVAAYRTWITQNMRA